MKNPRATEINDLIEALRPFAEFDDSGRAWQGTAWEHQPEDAAVLYDHKTKRVVTMADFANANAVLKRVTA